MPRTTKSTAAEKDASTAEKQAVPAKKAAAPAKKVAAAPAKAAAAPAPAAVKKAVPKTGPLDKFTEGQVKLLHEERETYMRQATALRAEADQLAQDRDPGDVQFDEESGQGDSMNVERERDLALSSRALESVDEIDRALLKVEAGTYGICEKCGTSIPKERLKALPAAALCVQCKSGGLSRR